MFSKQSLEETKDGEQELLFYFGMRKGKGMGLRKIGQLMVVLSFLLCLCSCGNTDMNKRNMEEETNSDESSLLKETNSVEEMPYSNLLIGGLELSIPLCFGELDENRSTDTNKYYYAEKVGGIPMLMISHDELDASQEEFNIKKKQLVDGFFSSIENVKVKDTKDIFIDELQGIAATASGTISGIESDIWVSYIYNIYEKEIILFAFSQSPGTEYDYISPYESIIQNAVVKSEKEVALEPLELVESGYAVKAGYDTFYIQYAVIVKNPNAEKGVRFPKIRITAKNANNEILGTSDIVGKEILPNGTWHSAFQGCSTDEEPATVEFELIQPGESDWVSPELLEYAGEDLQVENPLKHSDKIVGEILNPNDYDINGAGVTVLFRDESGKLLAGETTYTDKIPANGKIPFELSFFGRENEAYITENFEVYVYPWY